MLPTSKIFAAIVGTAVAACLSSAGLAQDYAAPKPLKPTAQAPISGFKGSKGAHIAYMPPGTEFNYYIAIGEGIKAEAARRGVETFMLAPQSGADISGQMTMLQDVITRGVQAIIFSTHDEFAAQPLIKKAVDAGIAIIIVNSDIPDFPAPVHAVVGYSQRGGTHKEGDYAIKLAGGKPQKLLVIEGQPGYHSTERCGGFLDAVKAAGWPVLGSLDGKWNVDGGEIAARDLLTAHPDAQVIFAANDYEITGASLAAKALGRTDLKLYGNDGDTAALEKIYEGVITATVNTTPYVMGEVAMKVALDVLDNKYKGGWVETPGIVTDKSNVLGFLQHPENLYPKPSRKY